VVDTGTKIFAAVGGILLVFVGMWAVVHNNGEHVRFSASVGSSYSPAMRRFSGILVAVVGVVAATVAVVQLFS
jgi:small neutral amino acid transporter SnatA (MarC family)